MPIYEFACQDCGYEFEQIQSFSDSSTPACPNCQGRHVQRRLSTPAIHFKGSGWYITDSRNAAKGSTTGSAGGAGSEGGKGGADNEAGKGDGGKSATGKSDTGKSEGVKSDAAPTPSAASSAAKTTAKEAD